MTVNQFAKRLDISPRTLKRIESGHIPSLTIQTKILAALGKTPNPKDNRELFPGGTLDDL